VGEHLADSDYVIALHWSSAGHRMASRRGGRLGEGKKTKKTRGRIISGSKIIEKMTEKHNNDHKNKRNNKINSK
jgi:hypothetical protein